jgi:hypothetical protein
MAAGAPAIGFVIDERLDAAGEPHRTTLRHDEHKQGFLAVEDDGVLLGHVSELAVRTVMQRYARALEDQVVVDGPWLALGEDRLRRMRYRAAVDAIGRDYLVWESGQEPPAAALSISVAAALRHLATMGRQN